VSVVEDLKMFEDMSGHMKDFVVVELSSLSLPRKPGIRLGESGYSIRCTHTYSSEISAACRGNMIVAVDLRNCYAHNSTPGVCS
jgi:hypothetical protein